MDVPPSLSPVLRAFSISSIQSTQGATVSASVRARRMFSSDCPTRLPKAAPMSRRMSGSRHIVAIVFAVSDLPVPGMPISAIPFGAGRPYSRASLPKARSRIPSHCFNVSRPPTSAAVSCGV